MDLRKIDKFLAWDADYPGPNFPRLRVVAIDADLPTGWWKPNMLAPDAGGMSPLGPFWTWYSFDSRVQTYLLDQIRGLKNPPAILVQVIPPCGEGLWYASAAAAHGTVYRPFDQPGREPMLEELPFDDWAELPRVTEAEIPEEPRDDPQHPRRKWKRAHRRAYPAHPLDAAGRALQKTRRLLLEASKETIGLTNGDAAKLLARVQYARGALGAYLTQVRMKRVDDRRRKELLLSTLASFAPVLGQMLEARSSGGGGTTSGASLICRPVSVCFQPQSNPEVEEPHAWACCACWKDRRAMTVNSALSKRCDICRHERCDGIVILNRPPEGPGATPRASDDGGPLYDDQVAGWAREALDRYVVALNRSFMLGLTVLDAAAVLSPVTVPGIYEDLSRIPYEEFAGKIQGMLGETPDASAGDTLASTKGTLWLRTFYVQVIQPYLKAEAAASGATP